MIFILICAFAAVGVGFAFLYARNDRLKNAEIYIGTIIGFDEKMVKRGVMFRKVVRPSVRYDNGRREIIAQYSDFMYAEHFNYSVGDEIRIRAYPQLPKIFYLAEADEAVPSKAIASFIIGGAFFVFWVMSEILIG
jgi:hypothetical protein